MVASRVEQVTTDTNSGVVVAPGPNLSLNWGATPPSGQLLVCIPMARPSNYGGNPPTFSMPAGWAEADYQASTNHSEAIWWKVAGAGEPTTVTVTVTHGSGGSGNFQASLAILRFTGATAWEVSEVVGADSGGSNAGSLVLGTFPTLPGGPNQLRVHNSSQRNASGAIVVTPTLTDFTQYRSGSHYRSALGWEDVNGVTAGWTETSDGQGQSAQYIGSAVVFNEGGAPPAGGSLRAGTDEVDAIYHGAVGPADKVYSGDVQVWP